MKHKTFEVPDGPEPQLRERIPFFSWGSPGEPSGVPYQPDLRDTSQPLFYDEAGNPVYGPRGIVMRWPG
jgi:hypothetical protein